MNDETKKQKHFAWNAAIAVTKKILYVLLLLLCAFLIFVTVWLSVDKLLLKSPVPSFLGYSLLSGESGSMEGDLEDSIAKKDLILIRKAKEYRVGETVTYLRPGDSVPTTHRIVELDDTSGTREYITRGDANGSSKDVGVSESMILGKVVLVFHGVGAFRSFLTEGYGYVFLITFAVILFAGFFFLKTVGKDAQS